MKLLNIFRRKRPALEDIGPTAFMEEDGAWMFFVARLHSYVSGLRTVVRKVSRAAVRDASVIEAVRVPGVPDPSSGGEEFTQNLKAIGRLEPGEIAVAIADRRTPSEERPALVLAERYDVLSARKLFMTRDAAS